MIGIDHLAEFTDADLAELVVFHPQHIIHTICHCIKIMGHHQNGSLIPGQSLLERHLGISIQMTGWLVQQQQVCMHSGDPGNLQQIFLTAGQILHPVVSHLLLKTIGFQISDHIRVFLKSGILEILKNRCPLVKYLSVVLGQVRLLYFRRQANGRILIFVNVS